MSAAGTRKRKAKRGPGKPRHGRELKRKITVSIDVELAEKARRLGEGNASAGIERALREISE